MRLCMRCFPDPICVCEHKNAYDRYRIFSLGIAGANACRLLTEAQSEHKFSLTCYGRRAALFLDSESS